MLAFEITLPADHEDLVTARLWELGTAGVEVRPGPAAGDVVLLAYFEERPDLEAALGGRAGLRWRAVDVPEVDWVARFREGFCAFQAGRFRIVPEWEAAPRGPQTLVVDPGRAFGTGTHESTRLCLSALETLAAERPLGRVLDVGTGTGLLAIAALRLGAALAVGLDNDAEALGSARRHAQLNGVPLHLVQGDGAGAIATGRFDVVLANLSEPLLRAHREELAAAVRPGGHLVLAGLLATDADALAADYASCGDVAVRREGEWAGLVVRRPA